MQRAHRNFAIRLWNRDRVLFVFLFAAGVLHILWLFLTFIDCMELRKVDGTITSVDISNYKKETYVKLRLSSDKNIYYQVYYKRFQDDAISDLDNGNTVTFYTTAIEYKKRRAILSSDEASSFKYYPIFNINNNKKFFDVFLFHLYRNSFFTILLYISIAGSLFYLIPFAATTNWKNRIIILAIVAAYVWFFY